MKGDPSPLQRIVVWSIFAAVGLLALFLSIEAFKWLVSPGGLLE